MSLPSTWQAEAKNKMKSHASCQTPESLFQLQEREIQSGRFTKVVQLQVKEQDKGASLVDYIAEKRPEYKADDWDTKIKDGFVTVDCEVNTDPISTLGTDYFIEYVEHKSNKSIQTEPQAQDHDLSQPLDDRRVAAFLDRIYPAVESALIANTTSRALDVLDFAAGSSLLDEQGDRILYWKQLTVDLEKKKVLYPDWIRAKYVTGNIIHCAVTRNKERIYDIEYDDGAVIQGVKEDYIRLLDDPNDASGAGGGARNRNSSSTKRSNASAGQNGMTIVGSALAARLQEGVRVHARVMGRNGQVKYLPGRVVKVGKNLFDIECEGIRVETNLSVADLCIGLSAGQQVEARKPSKTWLHATGMSWNATGSVLAVSYGRLDITGWCDFPGALCMWNVFQTRRPPASNNNSNNDSEVAAASSLGPEVVLDHASCLMSVACHPLIPSVIAAGSFNGEIVLWDLTQSEGSPWYVSPIIEYAHKDAVIQVHWVYVQGDATSLSSWQVLSLGADGRVLFWSVLNKLQHPVRGYLMSKSRSKTSSSSSSSKRMYPVSHGASAAAISMSSSSSGASSSSLMSRPTWLIIGQEGGHLLRVQFARLFGNVVSSSSNSNVITAEMLRSLPPIEDVFPSLRLLSQPSLQTSNNSALHSYQQPQGHVGSVTAIDWSPFHRNLYLSVGSDGVVKLFHTLQPLPLFKVEPAATVPYANINYKNSNLNGYSSEQYLAGGGGKKSKVSSGAGSGDTGSVAVGLVSATAVKFSSIRPTVFAVALSDGRVCIYDLYRSELMTMASAQDTDAGNSSMSGGSSSQNRSALLPAQVLYVTSQMTVDAPASSQLDPASGAEGGVSPAYAARAGGGSGGNNGTAVAPVCVTGLAFNHKHRDVLAAVDWLGRAHVWRLSASLCTRKRDELSRWERVGRTSTGNGTGNDAADETESGVKPSGSEYKSVEKDGL